MKAQRRCRHADCLMAAMDGGRYVDIQNDFSWAMSNLTDRQRLFVFYYVYPFDNGARGNGAKAARLAGYSKRQARRIEVKLLQCGEIQLRLCRGYPESLIAIQAQIATKSTKVNMECAVNAYIADKINRTRVNPLDYYTFEER